MSNESTVKGIAALVLLAVLGFFLVWFYSHKEEGVGTIDSKWVKSSTSTSCDSEGKNCTTSTSHTYYVQFKDGRIYNFFWGTRDWDRLHEEMVVSYHARGVRISFFGWRVFTPTIFSYAVVEEPR